MLAATMIGGGKYANQVALTTVSSSWFTVPSGLTTVYLNCATAGGEVQSPAVVSGMYRAGGGGGAALRDVALTVTPTNVIGLATQSTPGFPLLYRIFTATSMANAIGGIYSAIPVQITDAGGGVTVGGIGGSGASVAFLSTSVPGGLGGASDPNYPSAGENGQVVVLGTGGTIFSGAGGGGGGYATYDGTYGGSVGNFNGTSNAGKFGGSGGGFFPGNAYVSSSPDVKLYANTGTTYFYINY